MQAPVPFPIMVVLSVENCVLFPKDVIEVFFPIIPIWEFLSEDLTTFVCRIIAS